MNALTRPLTLPNGTELQGRVFKAAMSEALATPAGAVTPELITLYRHWGKVPAAGFFTGNIQVERRYLEHPLNVVLDRSTDPDGQPAAWAASIDRGRLWAQLNHAGRQTPASVSTRAPSPSAVSLDLLGYAEAFEMSEGDMAKAVEAFASAAQVARDAGFGGVQVHAAHGYLLSSFLSPHVNRRDDRWGGTLANRARLLEWVIDAVRTATGGEIPLAVKLNASDFRRGGFTPEDAAELAAQLEGRIDLLEISGGTFETPRAYATDASSAASRDALRESFFVAHTARIRERTSTPLMVTGGWRSRAAIEAAIDQGHVDLVGMARPFVADPDSVTELIEGHREAVAAPEREVPTSVFARDVLDWFCWQLYLRATRGTIEPKMAIETGAALYRGR